MKRFIPFVLLLWATNLAVTTNLNAIFLNTDKYKNAIVTESEYRVKFGEVDKEYPSLEKAYYDAKGNKTQSEGGLLGLTKYFYNEQNKEVRSESYDGKGNLTSLYKSYYDSKGYLVKWEVYEPNGDLRTYLIMTNDLKGNELIEDWYNDGELTERCKYSYDENNNWITEKSFNSKLEPTGSKKNFYDKKGRLIRREFYWNGGEVHWMWKFYNDENGNVVKIEKYDHKTNNDVLTSVILYTVEPYYENEIK